LRALCPALAVGVGRLCIRPVEGTAPFRDAVFQTLGLGIARVGARRLRGSVVFFRLFRHLDAAFHELVLEGAGVVSQWFAQPGAMAARPTTEAANMICRSPIPISTSRGRPFSSRTQNSKAAEPAQLLRADCVEVVTQPEVGSSYQV
jgi:hypothetical protein